MNWLINYYYSRCLFLSISLLLSIMTVMTSISVVHAQRAEMTAEELTTINNRLKFFDYESGFKEISNKLIDSHGKYNVRRIQLEGNYPDFLANRFPEKLLIEFDYYQLRQPEDCPPSPLILIIPSIAGVTPVEKNMAKILTKQNISSVIIKQKKDLFSSQVEINQINAVLAISIVQFKTVIDWAQSKEELNPDKIGAFGMSLGGILGSLLLGVEPRLKAGVFAVAGGDLAEIFTYSQQPTVLAFRQRQLKKLNITRDEFKKLLQKEIILDPLVFGPLRNCDELILFVANKDKYVPTRTQRALWEAFGRPYKRVVHGGHPGGVASLVFYLERILIFFNNHV